MATRLPPLNALRTFEAAARHLSFKKAADELSVTPTAVSHQIQQLEEILGNRLFVRLNRSLELTAAGEACLPKLQESFELMEQSMEEIQNSHCADTLTISAAPAFAMRWLMPRLHRFAMAHPNIDVRVSTQIQLAGPKMRGRVRDRERENVKYITDEMDIAITFGKGDYRDLWVDKVLSLSITPLCSPKLLHGSRPLREPADIRHHDMLHDDRGKMYEGKAYWKTWLEAVGVTNLDLDRGTHFTHSILALEAAAEGLGVAISTPSLASADLQSGRLVMPFACQVPLDYAYYMVGNEDSAQRNVVKLFRAWLLEEASRTVLGPVPEVTQETRTTA
jgi:LysR family glycine cleavage system transcriptional activator